MKSVKPRPPRVELLEGRVLFATVPAGFVDTSSWASGLTSPTAMGFAPDGRLFVCQQSGLLRVIKPTAQGTGQLLATPFLTKTVDSNGERGLLSVEFDPNFLSNGYVYVYYTVPGTGVHNRVSRFTAADADPDPNHYVPGDTAQANSEVVLMDLDPLSSATNHNGGGLHFGADGKLYVSVGENANSANAQTLSNRLGKMLRINPDGSIPTDNPFYTTATGANRAIWSLGLRNPFTFAVQPGTGRLFINDVGQSAWEEVDEGRAGANYGWPATEGDFNQAQFPQFTRPIHAYGRSVGTVITGGAFYNPTVQNFPSEYLGDYFFADNGSGWIHKLEAPIPSSFQSASNFATGIGGPVDLDVGPDGALYYLARSAGRVGRIRYAAPVITTQPSDQTVTSGQPATFTVVASGDPTLSYRWQRLAPATLQFVDIPGATSATYTLPSPTTSDSGARFRVVISNGSGSVTSNEVVLTVQPRPAPNVVGTFVFYNNSAFDGFDPGAGAADDAAIATDKVALGPGQHSSFANMTSYGKGINGVMADVQNLQTTPAVAPENFNVSVSTGDGTWQQGPAPTTVAVRPGAGVNGSDRVTAIWADGAIVNEWMQVIFLPPYTPDAGAVGPAVAFPSAVFAFGNLRGESGDPQDADALRVNALDVAGTKGALTSGTVPVDSRFDFNRDRHVNALDIAIVKSNLARALPMITAPAPPAAQAAGSASVAAAPPAPARVKRSALESVMALILRLS